MPLNHDGIVTFVTFPSALVVIVFNKCLFIKLLPPTSETKQFPRLDPAIINTNCSVLDKVIFIVLLLSPVFGIDTIYDFVPPISAQQTALLLSALLPNASPTALASAATALFVNVSSGGGNFP